MSNDTISFSDLQARMKAAEAEFLQAEEAVRKAVEQRDRLRTALQVFEEMLGAGRESPASPVPARSVSTGSRKRSRRSSPKRTKQPSAAERAIQELEAHGDFLTTNELLEILLSKGFKTNPKAKPYDALYGLLWHGSKKAGSRLVNRDMKWGLREWVQKGGQQ